MMNGYSLAKVQKYYIKNSKKATNTFIITNYSFIFAENLDYYEF